MVLGRRSLLVGLGCLLGCGTRSAPPLVVGPPQRAPSPRVRELADLLTSAGLEWLVRIEPARLLAPTWLRPSLARVLQDERLELSAQATGVDLREVPELCVAAYRGAAGAEAALMVLVRHRARPVELERKFRERLSSGEHRTVAGDELVAMSGLIGTEVHGFVAIGRDVAGYQYGGDLRRGPIRIAMLYAEGRLAQIPRALAEPAVAELCARLAGAPVLAVLPGPFEGELGRGARGLLGGATGVVAALVPTEARTLRLELALGGAFRAGASPDDSATHYLELAWADLGASDLGHLLGLHAPVTAPRIEATPAALTLVAELDAAALFDGLAAATTDDVREIMLRAGPRATPEPPAPDGGSSGPRRQ